MKKKENSVNSIIWTDRDQTASIIWKAYSEHAEKFDEYILNINLGGVNPLVEAGVYRKASAFYFETQDFYDKFKVKLGEVDVLRVHALFRNVISISVDNHVFLRRFFSKFMVQSGIRNIIMQKSNVSAAGVLESRYDLSSEQQ